MEENVCKCRFDHQFESWGVDVEALKEPVHNRTFYAWLLDWEEHAIHTRDAVSEAMLLEKYKGLYFRDSSKEGNGQVYRIEEDGME